MTRTSYAVGLLGLVAILNFFVGVPVALANTYATYDSANCGPKFALSGANLIATHSGTQAWNTCYSNISVPAGKWYWEMTFSSINTGIERPCLGIAKSGTSNAIELDSVADGYCYEVDGTKGNNNTTSAYGSSYTNGDHIGIYYDTATGNLGFTKNGVDQGVAFSGLSGTMLAGGTVFEQNAIITANYGPSTANTPPSGYNQGLYTAPIVTPLQFFNTFFFGDWF